MIKQVVFLGNDKYREILPSRIDVISSEAGLFEYLKVKDREYSKIGFLVLGELRWSKRYFTDYQGIEIIDQLRVEFELISPIILTSFNPAIFEDFQSDQSKYAYQNKLRILRDPSILFFPMGDIISMDFRKLCGSFSRALDLDFLKDLKSNIYQIEGYIKSHFHILMDEVRKQRFPLKRTQFLTFLRTKLSFLAKTDFFLESLEKKSFGVPLQNEFNSQETIALLKDLAWQISLEFEKRKDLNQPARLPDIETIYVSTDQALQTELIENISSFGIRVFKANSSLDLISLLEKKPSIGVIICDFRFFEDNKRLSWEQGYHIYDIVADSTKSLYEFIMITDFVKENYPARFRRENITPFSRNILTMSNQGFPRLAQSILQRDLVLRERNSRLPVFGDLMEFYVKHRTSSTFEQFEADTSNFVLSVIDQLKAGGKADLPKISNVSGSLKTTKKAANFINFRKKLKARRLALSLLQLRPKFLLDYRDNQAKWSAICLIIRAGKLSRSDREMDMQQINSFLSSNLIKLKTKKDYHWTKAYDTELNLTPEERNWLNQYGSKIELDQGLKR